MEWNGIEIFDRKEGRTFSRAGEDDTQTESLINTPYPKSAEFCSAPKRVYWELTRRCNLNCDNCYNRFSMPGFAGEMDLEECKLLGKTLYENGVWIIQLTGGEPTTAPHVWELASYLRDLGFYLAMGTNGVFTLPTMTKALESDIDWFIISMDPEHDSQSADTIKNGSLSAVETARALARDGRRVRVNTLIQEGNYTYEQLRPLAETCVEIGVESLNCIPLRPFVQSSEALKKQLTRDGFRVFIEGLELLRDQYPSLDFITTLDLKHTASIDRVYSKDKSCAAGREGCVISPYGEVYGCSYSPASSLDIGDPRRSLFVAGSIRERNFMDIWNDSERWAIYRDLRRYKNKRCQICVYYLKNRCIGNCPIMVKDAPEAFDPYCYIDAWGGVIV
jgi:radical SAM protein with 4Fe4S-binding SPASM domain